MASYPLEALRGLRAEEEDAARHALAAALRAQDDASAETRRTRAIAAGHAMETEATLARESQRPLEIVKPSDATQLRAWRARRREELATLEAHVRRAEDHEAACARVAESAREALAVAGRERESIEKHHSRWAEHVRRAAEAKEEAEAEDRRR